MKKKDDKHYGRLSWSDSKTSLASIAIDLCVTEHLKGVWLKILSFRLFFTSCSFPYALYKLLEPISNFYENSWKYSQQKVNQRYPRQEIFSYFVVAVLTTSALNLSLVSLFPAQNYRRRHCYRWLLMSSLPVIHYTDDYWKSEEMCNHQSWAQRR